MQQGERSNDLPPLVHHPRDDSRRLCRPPPRGGCRSTTPPSPLTTSPPRTPTPPPPPDVHSAPSSLSSSDLSLSPSFPLPPPPPPAAARGSARMHRLQQRRPPRHPDPLYYAYPPELDLELEPQPGSWYSSPGGEGRSSWDAAWDTGTTVTSSYSGSVTSVMTTASIYPDESRSSPPPSTPPPRWAVPMPHLPTWAMPASFPPSPPFSSARPSTFDRHHVRRAPVTASSDIWHMDDIERASLQATQSSTAAATVAAAVPDARNESTAGHNDDEPRDNASSWLSSFPSTDNSGSDDLFLPRLSSENSQHNCEMGGIFGAVGEFLGSFRIRRSAIYDEGMSYEPPDEDDGNRDPLEQYMLCPIRQEIMVDPVVDDDGHSYEREAILEWLSLQKTSPVTRRRLTAQQLRPNRALQAVIQQYRKNKAAAAAATATATATSPTASGDCTAAARKPVAAEAVNVGAVAFLPYEERKARRRHASG